MVLDVLTVSEVSVVSVLQRAEFIYLVGGLFTEKAASDQATVLEFGYLYTSHAIDGECRIGQAYTIKNLVRGVEQVKISSDSIYAS